MTPCTRTRFPVPEGAKHPHSTMLPPPCLTVGTVFSGLKASSFLHQTSNIHMPKQLQFSFIRPKDRLEAHNDEEHSQQSSLKHQVMIKSATVIFVEILELLLATFFTQRLHNIANEDPSLHFFLSIAASFKVGIHHLLSEVKT